MRNSGIDTACGQVEEVGDGDLIHLSFDKEEGDIDDDGDDIHTEDWNHVGFDFPPQELSEILIALCY